MEVLFTRGTIVYAVRTDGTRLQPLVDASGPTDIGAPDLAALRITHADLHPDGARIAYSTCQVYMNWQAHGERTVPIATNELWHEIAVWDRTTGETELLTVGDSPVWSPDGAHIAFVSGEKFHRRLFAMDGDGSDIRQLLDSPELQIIRPPRWSPDGRRLAFVGEGDTSKMATVREATTSGGYPIVVVDADGSNLRRLTNAISDPAWSPDGRHIAFARPDPGTRDLSDAGTVGLYVKPVDGSAEARRVASIDDWQVNAGRWRPWGATHFWISSVAWSPDGSMILYTCGWRICVVDLTGKKVGRSPQELVAARTPVAAWSRDGTRIALGSVDVALGLGERVIDEALGQGEPVLATMRPNGSEGQHLVRAGLGLLAANSNHQDVAAGREACAAGFVVDEPLRNPGLVRDCETLRGLRDTLFGRQLANWGPGGTIEQWTGVAVAGAPSRVTALLLPRLGLDGTIPVKLAELTHLRVLDLSSNGLTGAIPGELGQLANLEELRLRSNHLTGTIPEELGQLANLEYLHLGSNRLTGTIPEELGQLTSLAELGLGFNQLTGDVPLVLGRLKAMLWLGGNKLTGCLPPEVEVSVQERGYVRLPPPCR